MLFRKLITIIFCLTMLTKNTYSADSSCNDACSNAWVAGFAVGVHALVSLGAGYIGCTLDSCFNDRFDKKTQNKLFASSSIGAGVFGLGSAAIYLSSTNTRGVSDGGFWLAYGGGLIVGTVIGIFVGKCLFEPAPKVAIRFQSSRDQFDPRNKTQEINSELFVSFAY